MIKYLNSRDCPHCRSAVTIMHLRYSSQLSTINGVCGQCNYSIKWLIIEGNAPRRATINPNPRLAAQALENDSDNQREVLRS